MKAKKIVIILTAIIFLFTVAWFFLNKIVAIGPRVEVLLYHEFKPGGSEEWPIIDPEDFYCQINTLLEWGWEPLTLEDFDSWQQGRFKIQNNSFLLTFDDGGESIYHYAYPFLLEKQVPATIFLIAKHHDPDHLCTDTMQISKLTAEQIREMSQSEIISFQSHSYDLHGDIDAMPAILVLSPEKILADFLKSRLVIRRLTGKKVNSIAYPGGLVNQEIIALASKAGFEMGFAGNIQGTACKEETMSIKRFPLDNISSDVFNRYYGAGCWLSKDRIKTYFKVAKDNNQ